jgi:hypothetical protein
MPVRPTHFTLRVLHPKSWVIEGSLDGRSLREIDRSINNQDCDDIGSPASLAASNAAEFRFIRLTHATLTHCDWNGVQVGRFVLSFGIRLEEPVLRSSTCESDTKYSRFQ